MFPVNVWVSSDELPKFVEPDISCVVIFVTDEVMEYWFAVKVPSIVRLSTLLPSKSYNLPSEPVFCNRFWNVSEMFLFVKSNDISYNPYVFDNFCITSRINFFVPPW